MQSEMTLDRLTEMQGQAVYSVDGDKIGSVDEIFYDEATRQPEWLGIGGGFFGSKRVLVPIQTAQARDDGLSVPYSKSQVKDSPDIDGDEISEETERELYAYYGLSASDRRSDSTYADAGQTGYAGTSGRDTTAREGDMIRSEEELRVGKRETEAGSVRLRKWVETEPVQANVDLRRETVHVEREAIDQPVSGAQIGEDSVEVRLSREEAVVEKQAVAKERISLDKDVETESRTISDEVRKERVEVEGDDVTSRDRSWDTGSR